MVNAAGWHYVSLARRQRGAARHWGVRSPPRVPAHGDPVPRLQHCVSCGLCWPGAVGGVEVRSSPPEHSGSAAALSLCLAPAWVVPGLQEAPRASPAELGRVMSKLGVGGSSNRERRPQVFLGVRALPLLKAGFCPHPCFQLPRVKTQNGSFGLLSWRVENVKLHSPH